MNDSGRERSCFGILSLAIIGGVLEIFHGAWGCASGPPAWPTWSGASETRVELGGGMWRWSSEVTSRRTRRRTPPAIAEKLGGAASVAVVKATDLRQGDNATEFGLFDCARFR